MKRRRRSRSEKERPQLAAGFLLAFFSLLEALSLGRTRIKELLKIQGT